MVHSQIVSSQVHWWSFIISSHCWRYLRWYCAALRPCVIWKFSHSALCSELQRKRYYSETCLKLFVTFIEKYYFHFKVSETKIRFSAAGAKSSLLKRIVFQCGFLAEAWNRRDFQSHKLSFIITGEKGLNGKDNILFSWCFLNALLCFFFPISRRCFLRKENNSHNQRRPVNSDLLNIIKIISWTWKPHEERVGQEYGNTLRLRLHSF